MSYRQYLGLPAGPWTENQRIAFNLHKIAARVAAGEYAKPARVLDDSRDVRDRMAQAVLAFADQCVSRMTPAGRDLMGEFVREESAAFAEEVRSGARRVPQAEGEASTDGA